jgi:hypothetical protein
MTQRCVKDIISLLCALFLVLLPTLSMAVDSLDPVKVATGIGSIPARLLPDGTVCIDNAKDTSVCEEPLFNLPNQIMAESFLTFYGAFDLDNDGSPEVFFDYWPGGDVVYLLVYKKVGGEYSLHLKLEAESQGYAPGAWFVKESLTRRAFFRTRRCGSGGDGLFYLNLKKGLLELVNGGICLQDDPLIEDVNKDGFVEIFVQGRGRDRLSIQGAGLFHWQEDTYKLCWPDWTSPPYVIYANLTNLEREKQWEIVAVLETEEYSDELYTQGKLFGFRELAIWKITQTTSLVDKVRLPNSKYIGEPDLQALPNSEGTNEILLEYENNRVRCACLKGKIICAETKRR